jgi:hypothetical protein
MVDYLNPGNPIDNHWAIPVGIPGYDRFGDGAITWGLLAGQRCAFTG